MEAALDRDVIRVSSIETLTITVNTDDETRVISARPTDAIHDTLGAAFGRRADEVVEILLGDDSVSPGERFDEWGVEAVTPVVLLLSLLTVVGSCAGGGA